MAEEIRKGLSITVGTVSDNPFRSVTSCVLSHNRCVAPQASVLKHAGCMARPRVETPNLARLSALLSELAELRGLIETIENDVVLFARDLGATWEAIGEAHDPPIARQTAQKKYSHPKPRRQPPRRSGN